MNSLHLRLTLAVAALLSAVAAALIVVLGQVSNRYADEVLQRLNGGIAMYVVRELPLLDGDTVNRQALDELGRRAMTVNPSTEVYLLDTRGRILSTLVSRERIRRSAVRLEPLRQFLQRPGLRPIYGDDPTTVGAQRVFSAAPINLRGNLQGYLYVILGGERTQSIVTQLHDSYTLRAAAGAVLLVLVATLLVAALLFTALTRRLRILDAQLREWSATLPQGALGGHAAALRGDELDALTERFGLMSRAIERQIGELRSTDALRRELIANVSHDLRTPLAALRGHIETLQLQWPDSSVIDRQAYLQIALRQADRLDRMIEALFELAQLESGTAPLKLEHFAVLEWLHDVAQRFQERALRRGVHLSTAPDTQRVIVRADIELMERAIGNLLENALRSTPHGGQIRLDAEAEPDLVRIRVIDTGTGIALAHLPHVFDRFYSAANSGDGEHSGLGLAIVRGIITLHGQQLSIRSQHGSGTTVEFTLARAA